METITKLFNYRPEGQTITTNGGDKILLVFRKGPRGIVAVLKENEPIVIWGKDVADTHVGDTEEELKAKLIEVLNT